MNTYMAGSETAVSERQGVRQWLWRKHSLLQNLYRGLRFNKVLVMAKDRVFLDIKVCTEASLTLV